MKRELSVKLEIDSQRERELVAELEFEIEFHPTSQSNGLPNGDPNLEWDSDFGVNWDSIRFLQIHGLGDFLPRLLETPEGIAAASYGIIMAFGVQRFRELVLDELDKLCREGDLFYHSIYGEEES